MGKKGATRVTSQDISNAGGLPQLVKALVTTASEGDAAEKESVAAQLANLSAQNHFTNSTMLFNAGAVPPLVRILASGSAKSQSSAAAALRSLAYEQPEHQKAIVEAGGVASLARLLKSGSAKVQEEVHRLLAAAVVHALQLRALCLLCVCALASDVGGDPERSPPAAPLALR